MASEIVLYHAPHSTCSQKVRLCLAEKGLAWTSRLVNLRRFEHLEPAFLALNPDAMVPVLIDGGRVMRESLVINEYLDDAYPQVPLRPAGAAERAAMRQWTLYAAEEPTRAVKVPSFNRNIRPEIAGRYTDAELEAIAARIPDRETARRWLRAAREGFSDAEVQASLERLGRMLDRMEVQLRDQPWLAGAQYTLADVDMAPFVHRTAAVGGQSMIDARPRVADWYARLRRRPAFAQSIPA
jgi:glutathione S-transferase